MNKSNLESSQKITHPDYEIHYQILHKKMQRIFPVSADRSNCHSPGMLREKATFSSMHDANEKSHMMEKVFTALIANNVSELQNLLSGQCYMISHQSIAPLIADRLLERERRYFISETCWRLKIKKTGSYQILEGYQKQKNLRSFFIPSPKNCYKCIQIQFQME